MGKIRADDPTELTDIKLLSFDVYSTLIDEIGKLGRVELTTVPEYL
jgi:hypothetical protein